MSISDIVLSIKKADRLRDIFDRLGIKATFLSVCTLFEYNPYSFENYRILKSIRDAGHEIGVCSEIMINPRSGQEDATDCLRRDIEAINKMLNIEIKGIASHGGMTGLNNLDFLEKQKPSDFGLK